MVLVVVVVVVVMVVVVWRGRCIFLHQLGTCGFLFIKGGEEEQLSLVSFQQERHPCEAAE